MSVTFALIEKNTKSLQPKNVLHIIHYLIKQLKLK